jgi:hypothetical protein
VFNQPEHYTSGAVTQLLQTDFKFLHAGATESWYGSDSSRPRTTDVWVLSRTARARLMGDSTTLAQFFFQHFGLPVLSVSLHIAQNISQNIAFLNTQLYVWINKEKKSYFKVCGYIRN